MKTITEPEKLDLTSHSIADDKRVALLKLFPEARTEGGKLDLEKLKLVLGEAVDTGRERYGMNWPGKADCFAAIQAPSMATLRPVPEESIAFDSTQNLIIEGDNLQVLKLLQKGYQGKVKMIYIDPPYNTGKDFIYPDNYTEDLHTYLQYTGQVDAEGRKWGTNTDTDGRFHSKWLNMMYPRLYLARNLLREDGVVFISIDDAEISNLLKLADEVFGEDNFIAQLSVQLNPRGRHLDDFIAKTHEYVLVYGRDISLSTTMKGMAKEGAMVEEYDKKDERGPYRELGLRNRNQSFNPKTRPTLFFAIYADPQSGKVSVEKDETFSVEVWPTTADGVETCWTWSKKKIIDENELLIARATDDGSWRVHRKDYLFDAEGNQAETLAKSVWLEKELNNDEGRKAIKELLGESVMDFPKSPYLIQKMTKLGSGQDDIILDFFAGSGSTGQAVLELNLADGGHRRFILVQLPEPTDRKDYKTIAEITKERVRRVIKKLEAEQAGKLQLEAKGDLGFRVYKLAESNFKPWNAQVPDATALGQQMQLHVHHVLDGRTEQDLFTEILMKSGFPLTTPVEQLTLEGSPVYDVNGGELLVCLAQPLTHEALKAMATRKPQRAVCLDAGFADNDQLKANAVQLFKGKGVVFKTV